MAGPSSPLMGLSFQQKKEWDFEDRSGEASSIFWKAGQGGSLCPLRAWGGDAAQLLGVREAGVDVVA